MFLYWLILYIFKFLTNFQTPIDITSLSSPTSASGQSSNNLVPNVMRNQNTKYSRLATTGSPSRDSTKTNSVSSTQELLQNQIRQQEHLVNHQDAQLSQMSQSVGTLRNMSSAIGSELDEQAVMLDEFGGKNQTQCIRLVRCVLTNSYELIEL